MKQDHFTTAAEPESASARNRQRDGVQGSDKRSMRGLCMCVFVAYETRSLRNSSRKRFGTQQAKGRCSGI